MSSTEAKLPGAAEIEHVKIDNPYRKMTPKIELFQHVEGGGASPTLDPLKKHGICENDVPEDSQIATTLHCNGTLPCS